MFLMFLIITTFINRLLSLMFFILLVGFLFWLIDHFEE